MYFLSANSVFAVQNDRTYLPRIMRENCTEQENHNCFPNRDFEEIVLLETSVICLFVCVFIFYLTLTQSCSYLLTCIIILHTTKKVNNFFLKAPHQAHGCSQHAILNNVLLLTCMTEKQIDPSCKNYILSI